MRPGGRGPTAHGARMATAVVWDFCKEDARALAISNRMLKHNHLTCTL